MRIGNRDTRSFCTVERRKYRCDAAREVSSFLHHGKLLRDGVSIITDGLAPSYVPDYRLLLASQQAQPQASDVVELTSVSAGGPAYSFPLC